MNFGKLLAKLNNDIKTEVRHLEKLKKKLINLRWSKCFYETCQEKKKIYIYMVTSFWRLSELLMCLFVPPKVELDIMKY